MKKNILKKLGGLFLGLTMGLGIAVGVTAGNKASEVKADSVSDFVSLAKGKGTSGSGSAFTVTSAGISLDFDKAYGSAGTQIRSYAGGNCIVSYGDNITVSKIVFTWGDGKNGGTWTGGTLKDSDITWNSVTSGSSISNSAQARITAISIDYTSSGTATNFTVTFNANGHGTAPAAATVSSGGKVSKPADPTESGYTFGGWFKETGCTNEYDFNTAVTSSFTLYAKWTEESGGGEGATGSYTLVTSLSDLKNGDSVVIATDEPADGVTGVTGFSGSKDATVSTTLSEFLEYSVEVSGANYYLKDGKANNYIASPGGNEFKYGTKGAIAVDADGHMMSNSRYLCINGSSYRFYTSIGSYIPFFLYKVGQAASLVSISTLSGTVSAKTADTSWKIENVSVTGVLSDSANVVDVSKYVNVFVVESVPAIEQDGTMNVTLKATGKTETTVSKTVTVSATLKAYNPYAIENIYSAQKGDIVTIDGIYMGQVRDAAIIMDGVYGADLYYGTEKNTGVSLVPSDFNSYVPGETKLTITGTIDIYNNLVEVKPSSYAVLTDSSRISKIATPEVYIIKGTETGNDMELAARKTNATGVVTSITATSGHQNVNLEVNGHTVAIFVASTYATTDVMNALQSSKSQGTSITLEGFTSFFKQKDSDPFMQIQFTGLVEQKVDYLAADFAQDLLDLTDEVCAAYNGVTNNKNALNSVWLTLQDADHYLGLAGTEKANLASTTANVNGTTTEKAMARYDYLCVKYELTNFVERTLPLGSRIVTVSNRTNNNSAITAIIAISLVSITTLGVLITIKKRKTITK